MASRMIKPLELVRRYLCLQLVLPVPFDVHVQLVLPQSYQIALAYTRRHIHDTVVIITKTLL